MVVEGQMRRLKTAAAEFDVTYTEIWQAVNSGDLPGIQRGRIWWVETADVRAWLYRTGVSNQTDLVAARGT